jgi:hypothetical protein
VVLLEAQAKKKGSKISCMRGKKESICQKSSKSPKRVIDLIDVKAGKKKIAFLMRGYSRIVSGIKAKDPVSSQVPVTQAPKAKILAETKILAVLPQKN